VNGFWNEIQPSFPDPAFERSKIYAGASAAVVETRALPPSECVCSQYVFLMPHCLMPDITIGKNRISMPSGSMLACNPLQPIRLSGPPGPDFRATVLYLSNELLLATAQTLYGSGELAFREAALPHSPRLEACMQAFAEECRTRVLGRDLMLETYAQQMAVALLRESPHSRSGSLLPCRDYGDKASVRHAIEYLNDNYLDKITLDGLAREINYSPYHFLRLFRKHTGKSPAAFLLELRLEKARHMLEETDCSVAQASDLCGFGSPSHFSCAFKKHTGLSPTAYRKRGGIIDN